MTTVTLLAAMRGVHLVLAGIACVAVLRAIA